MFNKNDYYCIDGFPKEGYPCVVVLPPPYRQGYVYQGIKPAVIVLSVGADEHTLMEHVHAKQQAVLEKLKQKRAQSLATVQSDAMQTCTEAAAVQTLEVNIKKVEVDQTDAKQRDDSLEMASKLIDAAARKCSEQSPLKVSLRSEKLSNKQSHNSEHKPPESLKKEKQTEALEENESIESIESSHSINSLNDIDCSLKSEITNFGKSNQAVSPIIREQPSVHVSVDVRTQRSNKNEEILERDAFEHDRS